MSREAAHPFLTGTKLLYLNGRHVEAVSGKTFECFNPSTGAKLADVAEGDSIDIDIAVTAAREALEGPWRRVKPAERQAILLRFADLVEREFEELALLDTLDMGAPISRVPAIKARVVGQLRFFAGAATSIYGDTISNSLPGDFFSYTVKEPVGVVGAIIPWNGPLVAAMWKIGPVLATGCTLVLKPAEEAPLTTLRLAELCSEAGVPDGVINVVPGFGETAGAALAAHSGVDKVAFTGSHFTGQEIIRASAGNLKRVTLELGGKSPNIVFADADLDAAVMGSAMAIFANTGQVCSAGSRLFVERAIYEDFSQRVADFGKSLVVGPGADPKTQIGPIVSGAQLERVLSYMKVGKAEGAQLVSGGERITAGELAEGFFVPPTVFSHVEDGMRIAREEIFGPVLAAIPFDSEEEVLSRANDTNFGLGAGIWTRDVGRVQRVSRDLNCGVVWINCYQAMDPAVPFGGNKMSGYGREGGRGHVEEYLNVKSVVSKVG